MEELEKSLNSKHKAKLETIRSHCEELFTKGLPNFKYYTLHDIGHSNRIISIINNLVKGIDPNHLKLNKQEIFCLLASAYLHDVGMLIEKPDDQNIVNINIKNNMEPITKEDLIRKNHHLRSGEYIYEKHAELGLNPSELICIKLICEGHRLIDLNSYEEEHLIGNDPIRIRFLAALFRISDELDIFSDRAPSKLRHLLINMPPSSQLEWIKHHYTTGVRIEPPYGKPSGKKTIIKIQMEFPSLCSEQGLIIGDLLILKPITETLRSVAVILLSIGGLNIQIAPPTYSTNNLMDTMPPKVVELLDNKWMKEIEIKDKIEISYEGSVYGHRSTHFRYEKEILAKKVVANIGELLSDHSSNLKYCLLIDSGTTTYHIFRQICKEMTNPDKKELWKNRVLIFTNSLPGIQYLMANCKENFSSERSEISLRCFLLPGKPLQPYGAVACGETIKWLETLEDYLSREWKLERDDYQIISILSASYVVRHRQKINETANNYYCIAAREKGHVDIKTEFLKMSDKVYLVSPLTKFSFVDLETLNDILGYKLSMDDFAKREDNNITNGHSKIKYEEIPLGKHKCVFFTTKRVRGNIFFNFSEALENDLSENKYDVSNILMEEFDIRRYIDKSRSTFSEIVLEIPHKNLRNQYLNGVDIWDPKLIKD
ncbi:Chaperone protein HtpG [Methanosarcina siciliae T4/M]|uniref:Chaperone protein HtpG n=1 Tax=Methanosarcina siciliae T4/M TaxID=1434120 RepID=A0A0E3P2D9_9EURY|nr:hypothetical protein [Methanosarcina siciliae]AKB27652.1 Chaperone protein HtpG [Methanosarcina siciliae T4/M]